MPHIGLQSNGATSNNVHSHHQTSAQMSTLSGAAISAWKTSQVGKSSALQYFDWDELSFLAQLSLACENETFIQLHTKGLPLIYTGSQTAITH